MSELTEYHPIYEEETTDLFKNNDFLDTVSICDLDTPLNIELLSWALMEMFEPLEEDLINDEPLELIAPLRPEFRVDWAKINEENPKQIDYLKPALETVEY